MNKLMAFGLRSVVAITLAVAAVPAHAAGGASLTPISVDGFSDAAARGGAVPTGFSSVYIAPVGIVPGDARLDKLSARDRQTMQDYLADKLKQSLGARFTLVDAPGTGVLVVDAAFTTLQSNRLTIDQSSDNPNADVTHTFGIGRAGILITLKDGATDAVLATLSDEETGQSLANNPHTDTTWGDAMAFCREWAADLADVLKAR